MSLETPDYAAPHLVKNCLRRRPGEPVMHRIRRTHAALEAHRLSLLLAGDGYTQEACSAQLDLIRRLTVELPKHAHVRQAEPVDDGIVGDRDQGAERLLDCGDAGFEAGHQKSPVGCVEAPLEGESAGGGNAPAGERMTPELPTPQPEAAQ